MKLSRLIVIFAVLSLAIAAPASAGVDVPIKGTVIGGGGPDPAAPGCPGTPIWRYNSPGTGNVSHLGTVESFLTHCTYPDLSFAYGTITFTAANGDELVIAQEGSCLPILDGSGNFLGYTCEATWTAVDGTGRFSHATGAGTLDIVGDVPGGDTLFGLDGEMRVDIAGSISYDASDRSQR